MIPAIVLWFHFPDTVNLKVLHAGGFDILHSGSAHLLKPHAFLHYWGLLRVLWFLRQFVLKEKDKNVGTVPFSVFIAASALQPMPCVVID